MSFLRRLNPWGGSEAGGGDVENGGAPVHPPYAEGRAADDMSATTSSSAVATDPFASASGKGVPSKARSKSAGAAAATTTSSSSSSSEKSSAATSGTSTRRRWPWGKKPEGNSTVTEHDPFDDRATGDAPLDGLLRGAGSQQVLDAIQGEWSLQESDETPGGSDAARKKERPQWTVSGGFLHEVPLEGDPRAAAQRKEKDKKKINISVKEGVFIETTMQQEGGDDLTDDGAVDTADCAMVLKKALILSQSSSKRLVWSDGDVWVRPNEAKPVIPPVQTANEKKSVSYSLRGSSSLGGPPQQVSFSEALHVSCYDKHEVDGMYVASNHEKLNGYPVYCCNRKRLYSGKDGHWMFSSVLKMSRDLAVVSSAVKHDGLPPDLIEAWDYYHGGDGGAQPEWKSCTLMSIARLSKEDVEKNRFIAPRKPITGSVRQKIGDDQRVSGLSMSGSGANAMGHSQMERTLRNDAVLSEEEIRLILEVFFTTAVEKPDEEKTDGALIEDLLTYISTKKGTIVTLIAVLCKKTGVKDPRWTVPSLHEFMKNAQYYILKLFFATYDPESLSTADSLAEDIQLGRYSFVQVMRQICEKWGTKGARYSDWSGEFPVAARAGYRAPEGHAPVHSQTDLPLRLRRISDILSLRAKRLKLKAPRDGVHTAPAKKKRVARVVDPAVAALLQEEKAARFGIESEHHRSVAANVMPQKASLCIGLMAADRARLAGSLRNIDQLAAQGKAPTEDDTVAYLTRCSSLRQSVAASEAAAAVCNVPGTISTMVTSTKASLDTLLNGQERVETLVSDKAALQQKLDATSHAIKGLVAKLSEAPEDEQSKDELTRLNDSFTRLNGELKELDEDIVARADSSPLHAWMVGSQDDKKKEKDKEKKKDEKEKEGTASKEADDEEARRQRKRDKKKRKKEKEKEKEKEGQPEGTPPCTPPEEGM